MTAVVDAQVKEAAAPAVSREMRPAAAAVELPAAASAAVAVAPEPGSTAAMLAEGARAPWWRRHALALLVVALPLALMLLYYAASAQDRYVSTSVVTVRRAAIEAPAGGGLALLLSGVGGAANEDVRYLREYLHSLALMKTLDERLKLREHFESAMRDPFYRLWPGSSQEDMLDYWRSRVEITVDETSGLLSLRVQGFEPERAQAINAALLAEGDRFVNQISQRIAGEQVAFAQGELDRAAEALRRARGEVVAFQATNRVLDPAGEAQAVGALSAELRGQLARVEAELNAKRGYLNDDAPDVAALAGQAQALRLQIERETGSATRGDGKRSLGKLAVRFEDLKTQAGFAEQAYRAALAAVEATRIESARRAKSMVVIEPPTRPETAEYPRRLYNLAALLVGCLLVYAVLRMIVLTVREHRD